MFTFLSRREAVPIGAMLAMALLLFARICPAQERLIAVSIALPIEASTNQFDFFATLEPASRVDVRAAVGGLIRKVFVHNGEVVQEGQVLAELDDHSIRTKLESLKTSIEQLEAQLTALQSKTAKSLDELKDSNPNIETMAQLTAARDLVAANLEIQKAEQNRLFEELAAARITAPVGGRVVDLSVKEGDNIEAGPGASELICRIVRTAPVRACFGVDLTTFNRLRELQRGRRGSGVSLESDAPTSFRLKLVDEKLDEKVDENVDVGGSLDYLASSADPRSGLVRTCVIFPNENGALDSKALAEKEADRTVKVRLTFDLPRSVLLVNEMAIGRDRNGTFVLTVNGENRIHPSYVKLGPLHDGLRSVVSGLRKDEWLVIGTPAAKLDSASAEFTPIDFQTDLRFANLKTGAIVAPVKIPMPRPGTTLRDKSRDEHKAARPRNQTID